MLNGLRFSTIVLVFMCGQVEETPDPKLHQEQMGRATLGGLQYWTDHFVCHDWRIQHHVKFKQFRLLKPTNRVALEGGYDECRQAFDELRRRPDFPEIPSTIVVCVHGLGRTRNSMSSIGKFVSERGGHGWINFGYASTRSGIADNSRALLHVLNELAALKNEQDAKVASVADQQRGIEFHIIAHSLGNILVRKLLGELEQGHVDQKESPWRLGRVVMLGPPNHGSAMANLLKKSNAFRLIAGSSGQELGAEWDALSERLVTPKSEFAIIAGGKEDGKGFNPLLSGDDDLIVRVNETRLSGAADFAVIPSVHTYLIDRAEAKEMALQFIRFGFLKTAAERNRIP